MEDTTKKSRAWSTRLFCKYIGNINGRARALAAVLLVLLAAACTGALSRGGATFKECVARLENAKEAGELSREQAYFVDSLDVAGLHASSLWGRYINSWVASFTSPDSVPARCERLLGRVARDYPDQFKPLVAGVCRALKGRGAGRAAGTVAALPYGVDAAHYPGIAARLLVATLLPGQKAPALVGRLSHPVGDGRWTILFFYASDCRTCQGMASDLIERHGDLQKARARVITLSTDTNEELFAEYARKFPWEDKLCDRRGFDSPNMVAYGVAATPT
ncbi:MAG: peroxiredoxin family protein, partial [Odoribacteraceae bacterium]|nr:peroxiredoxin family protein [Odoribacteraceae bacterium]